MARFEQQIQEGVIKPFSERAVGVGNDTHLALLLRYLDICNHVMAANNDRFPYRQIWSALQDAGGGDPVIQLLHDGKPQAACIISLGKTAISAEPMELSKLDSMADLLPVYPVEMSYVLQVLASPDLFIADPSRINWDWIGG